MVCDADAGVVMTDGPLDDAAAEEAAGAEDELLELLLLLQAARASAAAEVSAVKARARWPRRPEPRRQDALYGAGNFVATAIDSFTVRTSDPCGVLSHRGRLPAALVRTPCVRVRSRLPPAGPARRAGGSSM